MIKQFFWFALILFLLPVSQLQASSSVNDISRVIRQQVNHALSEYRTRSNLNMRMQPQGKIINTLPKGSKVIVLEQGKAAWWKISFNNQIGWVHSNYLEKI